MIILDWHFFQIRSDDSREATDDVPSPFAVITYFKPDLTVELPECYDLSSLYYRFDQLRHTDNFFFALRVEVSSIMYLLVRCIRLRRGTSYKSCCCSTTV